MTTMTFIRMMEMAISMIETLNIVLRVCGVVAPLRSTCVSV